MECASTLKITVGHMCTCSGTTLRLKADNKKTELTRQTSVAVSHNFCLDDHEISAKKWRKKRKNRKIEKNKQMEKKRKRGKKEK